MDVGFIFVVREYRVRERAQKEIIIIIVEREFFKYSKYVFI